MMSFPRMLVLALVPALLCTQSAKADPTSKVAADALACVDQAYPKKIAQIEKEIDPVAEQKAMSDAKSAGGCTILKKGLDIFLEDSGAGGAITLIRPKGEVQSYWMQADHIDVN